MAVKILPSARAKMGPPTPAPDPTPCPPPAEPPETILGALAKLHEHPHTKRKLYLIRLADGAAYHVRTVERIGDKWRCRLATKEHQRAHIQADIGEREVPKYTPIWRS